VALSLMEIQLFQRLFSGSQEAYGIHSSSSKNADGKVEGSNFTKVAKPTESVYVDHLTGKQGIGIIPICTDNMCFFAVIDVDNYSSNAALMARAQKYGFPIIPFRSKSGGLHLYFFFSSPEKAAIIVSALKRIVRALGLPKQTEIFPKQTKLSGASKGNWINLPYFNAEKTERYMLRKDGSAAPLEEALVLCEASKLTVEKLNSFIDSLPLSDAPPCLQNIYLMGSTSHRNAYLFSIARYYKAKIGDAFEYSVVEANAELEDPISLKELSDTIIQSHKKKDYSYKCKDEPLCSLCDKDECKKRAYGIGAENVSELSFEELTQFKAEPPHYTWKVNSVELKFYSESEIIYQMKFRELAFRELHLLPFKIKDETWTKIVNNALANLQIVTPEEGEEISPGALFIDYIVEFLTKRAMAANKEQILVDRVYIDQERKVYVFKSKNLINFLFFQKQFRYYGPAEIQDKLKKMGGGPLRYYVNAENKTVRIWVLPIDALKNFIDAPMDHVDIQFLEEFANEAY
jgi:hypothetical protein